jgi:PqqD family protein of HPr-rel-A system
VPDAGGIEEHYVARADLRWRELGDDLLVFHPVSWDVHLLNTAAGMVLEACTKAPQSLPSMTSLLVDWLADEIRADADGLARSLLVDLSELGLIIPVSQRAGA